MFDPPQCSEQLVTGPDAAEFMTCAARQQYLHLCYEGQKVIELTVRVDRPRHAADSGNPRLAPTHHPRR